MQSVIKHIQPFVPFYALILDGCSFFIIVNRAMTFVMAIIMLCVYNVAAHNVNIREPINGDMFQMTRIFYVNRTRCIVKRRCFKVSIQHLIFLLLYTN